MKRLKKYKSYIYSVGDSNQTCKKKRKYLINHPEELEKILPVAIDLVIEAFKTGNLVEQNNEPNKENDSS